MFVTTLSQQFTTYVIAIPDSIEFLFDANLPEAVDISFSID